jgi:hypothetical protein
MLGVIRLPIIGLIRHCRIMANMIFIEKSNFSKLMPDYLSGDDYRGLQTHLLLRPDAGNIIRGSGGVRKVR